MSPSRPQPPRFADPGAAFAEHAPTVYRWACAMGCAHDQALDAVQECFARLVRADTPPAAHAARAWLRRTTASVVIDAWRAGSSRTARERAVRLETMGSSDPAASAEAHDAASLVREAVRSLSDQQRLVLVCKTVDGLTFQQIADELDLAVPTVKTHYLRALASLREALADAGVTEAPYAM